MSATIWTAVSDGFQKGVVDPGKLPEFFLLVAFLITFAFVRVNVHLIRAQKSWWFSDIETESGTHVHHMVFGIIAMIIVGYIGIGVDPDSPWREVLAVLFGIGAALTLDEFALWLNLEDVYWSEKGRQSIDAVIVAASLAALVLLGVRAWIIVVEQVGSAIEWTVGVVSLSGLVIALVNVAKGKYLWGFVSILIPLVGLIGAVRLARPGSFWARFYGEKRTARARARMA